MRFFCVVLILAFCLNISSCQRVNKPCARMLEEIMSDTEILPAGNVYGSQCEMGSEGYFPDSMRKTMYGDDCDRWFSLMEEYALFVSSSGIPCEIAVFKCYSATDARSVEFMCLNRAELLRTALRGTGFSELCGRISVARDGRVVLFIMAEKYSGNIKKTVS